MKNGFYFLGLCICLCLWASCSSMEEVRDYNEKYTGEYTSRIAFPIGGLGTGMFCVEGSGAISNMNIRHKTEMLNEPTLLWKDKYRIGKNLANHSQQKDTAARGDYLDLKIVILK